MASSSIPIGLITGANKGIGFEIAAQLGSQGYRLLIGARDQDRGEAATDDSGRCRRRGSFGVTSRRWTDRRLFRCEPQTALVSIQR